MYERTKIGRVYQDNATLIRKIFIRYSTDGVSVPEKAFRLTRQQFGKFAMEIEIMDLIKEKEVDLGKCFLTCARRMEWKNKKKIYPTLASCSTLYRDPLVVKFQKGGVHYDKYIESPPDVDKQGPWYKKMLSNEQR